MKNLGLILLAFFFSLSWAASKEVFVTVKGMVCSFCAQGITKKFSAQPSVKQVEVSLALGQVKITLKDNESLADDAIAKLLKDSGYSVDTIKRN